MALIENFGFSRDRVSGESSTGGGFAGGGVSVNNYVKSVLFSAVTGNLTLAREGLSDLSVNLDGRYALSSDLDLTLDDILNNGNTSSLGLTVGAATINGNTTVDGDFQSNSGIITLKGGASNSNPFFQFGDSSGTRQGYIQAVVGDRLDIVSDFGLIRLRDATQIDGATTINGSVDVLTTVSQALTLSSTQASGSYITFKYSSTTASGYIGSGAPLVGGAANDMAIRAQGSNVYITTDGSNQRAIFNSSGATINGNATVNGNLTFTGSINSGTSTQILKGDGSLESDATYLKTSAISGNGDIIIGADNSGNLSAVTIGSGLSYSGGVLTATGGASGTVTTSNSATAGRLAKFTSASNIEESTISETASLVTVDNALTVNGDLTTTGIISGNGSGLTNVNATTLDGIDSTGFEYAVSSGTTAQYYRGDKTWQSLDSAINSLGYITTSSLTNYARTDIAESFSSNVTVNGRVITDEIRNRTGSQLVLNVGESHTVATGQTAEYLYVNAESGLQINASPDNWTSGWAGRVTHTFGPASSIISTPLNVIGDVIASGNIYSNGIAYYGDNKNAIQFSDSWLRLNQLGDFSNGVYTPYNFRTDESLQVGSGGSAFHAQSTGNISWSGVATGDGSGITNVNATTLDGVDGSSFLRSDTNDTFTGALTVNGSITLDGILIDESDDRTGLLEVHRDGTNSWSGYAIDHSGQHWSLMGNAGNFGIYDDTNSKWAVLYDINAGVELYYSGSKKLETTSGGVVITGEISATTIVKSGGTSSQFLKANGSVDSNSYYLASNPNSYTSNTGTVTSVSVGTGLDVSSATTTPSITLDLSELTDMTSGVSGANDELILLDSGAERRKRIGEINLGQFNNDQGWTSNVGDITGVTAGTNLTGGGTSGSVTVNLASTVSVTGTMTAANFFRGSARHLKQDIKDLVFSWEDAKQVKTREYHKKASGLKEFGYVIDELPSKLQEVAREDKESLDYESVNTAMIAAMMNKIQELEKEIKELKK